MRRFWAEERERGLQRGYRKRRIRRRRDRCFCRCRRRPEEGGLTGGRGNGGGRVATHSGDDGIAAGGFGCHDDDVDCNEEREEEYLGLMERGGREYGEFTERGNVYEIGERCIYTVRGKFAVFVNLRVATRWCGW